MRFITPWGTANGGLWVILICLLAGPVHAAPAAEPISAALTAETVQLTTDFTGMTLSIYGAVDSRYRKATDVVVVARGPDAIVRVARKERVAGLWLDAHPVRFSGAPGFYLTASTRPLSDIAPFAVRRSLSLGPEHLNLSTPAFEHQAVQYGVPVVVNTLGVLYDDYRAALLRLMQKRGLYRADPFGVRFIDGGLFKADIRLPSRAPAGTYQVEIYLFRDGRLLAHRERELNVTRVGLERMVYTLAHGHPWFYGVLTVLMAMLTGLAAAHLFRRRWI